MLLADRRTDGRAEGQKDMTKLIVAFRNFANAPKKCLGIMIIIIILIIIKK